MNPFQDVEDEIVEQNPRLFRLEKIIKNREEPLEDFLIKFFTIWNKNRNTIYIDDRTIQTDVDKRRSLGDIFLISRYYYPDCALKEVLNLLYRVLPNSIETGFRTSYCSTINRRVWYFDSNYDSLIGNRDYTDEFGYMVAHYTELLGE